MLQFMSNQSAAMKEAEDLREKVRDFEGASPVRMLDAALIRASRWANRHESSFQDAEYELLKAEIESAGGNVQPIRVRPAPELLNGSTVTCYEVVYGHRRHRACLELGLPVQAMIEDASDQELFVAMERENRGRKNLSAWEQGCMYRRALDDGLYSSMRKLAEAVKVDVSLVSKSLALARLPEAVVLAFPSPNDIQFRWAQPLGEALQKDPDGVLAQARAIKDQDKAGPEALSSAQVFASLTQPAKTVAAPAPIPSQPLQLSRGGKKALMLSADAQGFVHLKFAPGVLKPSAHQALLKHISAFLDQDT
jgi:ParB family chromosome partitioning protein